MEYTSFNVQNNVLSSVLLGYSLQANAYKIPTLELLLLTLTTLVAYMQSGTDTKQCQILKIKSKTKYKNFNISVIFGKFLTFSRKRKAGAISDQVFSNSEIRDCIVFRNFHIKIKVMKVFAFREGRLQKSLITVTRGRF